MKSSRARTPSARTLPAVAFALAATALLSLSACSGGTTTDAGNPGIILRFRSEDKPVPFTGILQFFVAGANPELVNTPSEGAEAAASHLVLKPDRDTLGGILLQNVPVDSITRDELLTLVHRRPSLALAKSSTWDSRLDRFNVIVTGPEGLSAWVDDIHLDSAVDDAWDTLVVQLAPGRDYEGKVDTAAPGAGPPLALFVPGTPYFAQVYGNRFRFTGIPAGKLPLRWLSTDGHVHAMAESLGSAWTRPLRPGPLLDSIALPTLLPKLESPAADPPGPSSFSDSVTVILSAKPGAIIRFTLDGSEPGPDSKRYDAPIKLRSSATIKALAFLDGHYRSPVSINNYQLAPSAPMADPAGRPFRDSLIVSLDTRSQGAIIRYTLDGGDPGSASAPTYSGPLLLTATTTLKAIASIPGLGISALLQETYILTTDSTTTPP